jgi:hypothetical protein
MRIGEAKHKAEAGWLDSVSVDRKNSDLKSIKSSSTGTMLVLR